MNLLIAKNNKDHLKIKLSFVFLAKSEKKNLQAR